MNYLQSTQVISVYPTAYRDTQYDAQADNTTEYNVVNAVKRIGNRNFVYFYSESEELQDSDVALRVSIGGYAFEITKSGVDALKAMSGPIYLCIRTGDGIHYNEAQLLPAEPGEESVSFLDVDGSFTGLGVASSAQSGLESLYLFDSDKHIPDTSMCILDTTQIVDDVNGDLKPLSERITTADLDVNGPADIVGILSVKGVEGSPEIDFINKDNNYKVRLESEVATANRTVKLPNKSGEVLLEGTSKTPSATENVVKSIATESSSVLTGVTTSKANVINGVSSTAKNAYTTLNTSATGISSSSFNSSTGVLTLTSGSVVTGGSTTSMIQTVSSTTAQVVTDVTTPAGNKTSVISAVTPTAVDVASSNHTHEINND